MENPLDGLWIIDAEAKTVYVSDHMAEILFSEDIPAAQRLFAFKKEGDKAPFRFKLRRKDGSPIWVDVQRTPMFNAAGRFTGVVGTFTVSR